MHTGPGSSYCVGVLDDVELVIDGVRAGLRAVDLGWTVVAVSVEDQTRRSAGLDVVLWDPDLSPGRLERTERVVAHFAPTPVIGFSWSCELPLVMECLRQGCSGFLLKSLGRESLTTHLRRALTDPPVIDHRVSGPLLTAAARLRDGRWWPGEHLGLSRRESEILMLLVDGLDTGQIADSLYLGRETVRTHLRTLYGKLGVGTRTQAVARAYREGLVGGRRPGVALVP